MFTAKLLRLVSLAMLASSLSFAPCVPPLLAQVSADTARTARIVASANGFMDELSPDQRKMVLYAYDDAKQRARWSNFPTGFVPRGGISLKQMSPLQRVAVRKLLSDVLSPAGLEKVDAIRAADDDFKVNGSRHGPGGGAGGPGAGVGSGPPPIGSQTEPPPQAPDGRGLDGAGKRGGPPSMSGAMFGGDLYFISFLGTPSTSSPWMLQFGGHHLALNVTIAGSRGVLTPSLTGAQPAAFQLDGKMVRPLGRESDKAITLLHSLNDKQRAQAVLPYTVPDLVLGPGHDDQKIVPEGLKASEMMAGQQELLLDLIAEWAGILNDDATRMRMAQMKADLSDTWFAWSGPTSGHPGENIAAYYRIQGPHLVIEYAPQHDEPTNHVHTIYRDPTNDYGVGLVRP